MQNIVEFHIIGRLGRIDAAKKVTHISVATNYNRREGETWKSDPQWHRITLFDKMRDRLLSPDSMERIQTLVGDHPTLLLPVVTDELTGFNAIPDAMAQVLGVNLVFRLSLVKLSRQIRSAIPAPRHFSGWSPRRRSGGRCNRAQTTCSWTITLALAPRWQTCAVTSRRGAERSSQSRP